MFELIKTNGSWDFIWRGCVDVPYKYYFNDISLKKDGSFLHHICMKEISPLMNGSYISVKEKFRIPCGVE